MAERSRRLKLFVLVEKQSWEREGGSCCSSYRHLISWSGWAAGEKNKKKNTTLKKGKHEQAVGKAGQAGAKKMCAGETWSWGWWLDVMSSKKRGLTARSALLSLGADRWNRMICADGGDAPAMEKA